MSRTNLFRTELTGVDDTGEQQLGSGYGYAGEEFDKAPIVRQHGFTSHAPKGSHGIGIAGSGERGLVAFLGLEHQDYRQKNVPEGGSVVYDATGNVSRYLGDDGIWHDAGDRAQRMSGKTLELAAQEQASFGGKKVTYLGGNGKDGIYAPVMTASGPSRSVFAKL